MLEILGLAIAVTAISGLARGRGAPPVLVGIVAVSGFVLIEFVGRFFVAGQDAWALMILAWAWIAAVAGYVRFVVGARMKKPDSKWNCSSCRYLNNSSSVICEACQQPWQG
jgi:hypothetical protein